jgi:hypothetical protein
MLQMKMWVCGYCGKAFKQPKSCAKHEVVCRKNPMSMSCANCAHMVNADKWRRRSFDKCSLLHINCTSTKGLSCGRFARRSEIHERTDSTAE